MDERDSSGLRGNTNRKNRLIEALTAYKDSLEDGKYDFKDTAFTDLNDVKSKIQGAIDALNNKDVNDDNPALNKLGLSTKEWFYNGANDTYGTDSSGNTISYQ